MEGTRKRLSGQLAHKLTGDRLIDDAALAIYQATGIRVRQFDRLGVWNRCLEIASCLRTGVTVVNPASVAESSYRRGYQQALVTATEMLDRGATVEDIGDFAMGEIVEWRAEHHRGKFRIPPIWRRREVAA